VLGVGDGIADDVLEEDIEHTVASILVDEAGDVLHAAPPRQSPDRRLGDALDVVAEDLAQTLHAVFVAPRHGHHCEILGI
jgi:hypothetical protein